MKNLFHIIMLSLLYLSCHQDKNINDINKYIISVENSEEYQEIEQNYSSDHIDGDSNGGDFNILTLIDDKENIIRMKVNIMLYDKSSYKYLFYYYNNNLVYSKIFKLTPNVSSNNLDTIVNSTYFWKDSELIHQVNMTNEWEEHLIIKDLQESYYEIAFGLE